MSRGAADFLISSDAAAGGPAICAGADGRGLSVKERPGFERGLYVIGVPALMWVLLLNGPDDWALGDRVRTALFVTVLYVPLMYIRTKP